MNVKKIIVKYSVCVNGEWFYKDKMFDNWDDAVEYMSAMDQVYKFTVSLIKDFKK